jgi:hypothetical protein
VYTSPPVTEKSEEKALPPMDPRILVVFLILFALVIGAVIAIGIFRIPAGTPPLVSPATTTTAAPVPVRPANQTPVTGTIITGSEFSDGTGLLSLDNHNGGSDAVAVLTTGATREPLIAVYISKGERFTLAKIPDGNYDLYIQSGITWNISGKRFDKNPSFVRFKDPLVYFTPSDTGQRTLFTETKETHFTIYEVTLDSPSDTKTHTGLFSPKKGDLIAPGSFPVL